MTYEAAGFSSFFIDVIKGKSTSLAAYNSNLRKIDKTISGIEEYIDLHGVDGFAEWLRQNGEKFSPYASNVQSAARAYLRFRLEAEFEDNEENEPSAEENAASVFKYERELQAAVRSQLGSLEQGLIEADEGYEAVFPSGRSDIIARDRTGCAVVIELKAGACPKGTIEQALGYAQDWIDSGESRVRTFIIAGEFSPRIKAAAKRIPDLTLLTYALAVQFSRV